MIGSSTLVVETTWREAGACFDSDSGAFIPAAIAMEGVRLAVRYDTALAVCRSCMVITQCLHFAMATRQEYGVWGGTTPQQRQILRRHRSAS